MRSKHSFIFTGFLATLGLAPPAHAGGSFVRDANALAPACGGTNGCWTNHLRLTDFDGDGDLDVLLANYADFFTGGNNPEALVVYENDGSGGFTNVSAAAVNGIVGNFRQIAMGDIDGDGDLDMYAAQGNGAAHSLFVNQGDGTFIDEAVGQLPGEYPSSAAARMGDVDNDGDLDIFVADGYATNGPPFGRLYLNQGDGVFDESAGAIPDSISGQDIDDVELVDVDGDFDLDIMVNAHNGGIGALWLNDGTGVFAAGGTLAPPATGNNHYNATPCDVDGDGDLDLWIDNIGGNFTEQLQINDGSGNFTDETSVRVTGNPDADDNGVVCADIDNDGDMDAVVISLMTGERFLENDGDGLFTLVPGAFQAGSDSSLWGEFGDVDGDGRFDLVTGQGEGSTRDEVDLATAAIPVDDTAPLIRGVESLPNQAIGDSPVMRFAVSDRTVTDEGPRLNRAFVLLEPDGAATEVAATFVGGDLFRATLPATMQDAVVTFQACAEDRHGNLGCSEDQTFVVGEGGATTGGATTGDGSGSAGSGPGLDSTAGEGSGLTAATMTAGAESGDSTGPGATGDGGGAGGCDCRSGSPAKGWIPGLLVLAGLSLRRRRRA